MIFPLQITFLLVSTPSQVVPNVCHTKQGCYQEDSGDEDDPPGTGQEGFFCKGKHASPGNDLQRKANSHKT